jgi:hypothetical protein
MACTSTTLIVLGCKIPHELDVLKRKAIGRRREEEEDVRETCTGGRIIL